ncbi:2-iminoacetate synthase ThiH [Helicobacter zhangjianzhongii]|uniref:2-iminoacetate synthase ThiH n=1 Tax=Helicobacter zhangjianzhongii TaxID=2974574 RepID=UPI002554932F|nr:2-iminoacetate synthase ThiH [Helicobacter sp. CPD2-1]MDL0081037.1 2-iminoacetate synthase ThiH [Helicobacter sp. CPD2-1]
MRRDCMTYLPFMEQLDSDMLECVLEQVARYDERSFSADDVKRALQATSLKIEHLQALLSPAAEEFIEELAIKSASIKRKYFGSNIALFTPLYLSNHCSSKCVYCGFQKGNPIARAKLSEREIHQEMQAIAQSGLQEVLMLTGEGREYASVEYIARACAIAKEYFKVIGVEVYPMNTDEYALLHESGCEYVTIFQETYDPICYARIHTAGEKCVFPYRFYAQERALRAGFRGVGFGALLGIGDFRKDALATALHAHFLQARYPHAEIALSIPRLRPIINNRKISPKDVGEKRLLQVLCAYRLFLPYSSITISSRERKGLRDEFIKLGASKMSAGVSVGIGGKSFEQKGDEQFDIADSRGVGEIMTMLKQSALQPVLSDSIYVG